MSDSAETIEFPDFLKVEVHTGTIVEARLNPKARVAAYILSIDFGALGMRTSSAQITANYQPGDLVGKQIVAVTDFPPKRIAGINSEVLVLGAVSTGRDVVLLEPTFAVENGARIG